MYSKKRAKSVQLMLKLPSPSKNMFFTNIALQNLFNLPVPVKIAEITDQLSVISAFQEENLQLIMYPGKQIVASTVDTPNIKCSG